MVPTPTGGSNPYPPPDASRGATADLCDVHLPDPVDIVSQRKVQIVDPIFRYMVQCALNAVAIDQTCKTPTRPFRDAICSSLIRESLCKRA